MTTNMTARQVFGVDEATAAAPAVSHAVAFSRTQWLDIPVCETHGGLIAIRSSRADD